MKADAVDLHQATHPPKARQGRNALRGALRASVSRPALKPAAGEGFNRQLAVYAAILATAGQPCC